MNVLLIQTPHYYGGKSRTPDFFPLGLGYIARAVLDGGYNVDILDIYAYQYKKEKVIEQLKNIKFDIVGISAMSTQYNYVKWLADQIKHISPNKKIILGGALATFTPQTVLENTNVDICVISEGEKVIVELLHNIDHPEKVDGIWYKKNNQIFNTKSRTYIKNLDSISFSAYDLFPMDLYLKNSFILNTRGEAVKIKTANVICGRGCPFNCHFCSKVFQGLRLRSIDNIIEEIKYFKKEYNIEGVFFNDELVVVNKKRIYELCDKIRPLNLKWNCQGRVDTVDYELLKYMKKSGCTAVGYGIESGSQNILENMNKKTRVEQAEKAIKNTKKAGLFPIVQVMFGYPGETKETIQETINFFKQADNPGDELSPVTPLPGTQLWEYTLKQGLIKDEETLLENLDGGYMPDSRVLVNYTDFTWEEYNLLRKSAENRIRKQYYIRHPFIKIINMLYRIGILIRKYGVGGSIKKAFLKLQKVKKSK